MSVYENSISNLKRIYDNLEEGDNKEYFSILLNAFFVIFFMVKNIPVKNKITKIEENVEFTSG